MCNFKGIALLLSVFSTLYIGILSSDNRMKNFCYYTNWSNQLQHYDARLEISDINVTLCTHLIYAFANIDVTDLRLVPSLKDDDNGQLVNKKGKYFEFNDLKIEHPDLVTLLSVGGAAAKNGGFIQIVQSKSNMKLFSRNVATYLRDRDFDGIDIDWEWPGDLYREQFSQLLQVMWDEFVNEAVRNSKPRLLISIAVAVGEETIADSYIIPNISQHVDYIQVMAYDFHGPWSDVTSFSAPLFSRASNHRFNQQLSQAWAIDRWISGGAPRDKLIMGLTGVATTFTLDNVSATDVGSPVLGAGRRGPYMQQQGRVTYYRVCEMIRRGAVHKWDDEQKMNYAVDNDQWVGYGNQKSMEEKVKFAASRNIAGVMFWSLELDDFKGTFCNVGKFPLLTTIYNTIQAMVPKDNTGPSGASTASTPSTTPIDFYKHHRTNKNGINFYDMKDGNSANSVSVTSTLMLLLIVTCFML